jgi:hypothetical protein
MPNPTHQVTQRCAGFGRPAVAGAPQVDSTGEASSRQRLCAHERLTRATARALRSCEDKGIRLGLEISVPSTAVDKIVRSSRYAFAVVTGRGRH